MTDQEKCFHCDEPLPPDGKGWETVIDGEKRPMCCPGCQAVAEAIVAAGLEDYYRFRQAPAPKAGEGVPEELSRLTAYDEPEVQVRFVREDTAHLRHADLILEGITCPACIWLNEQTLQRLPGVREVNINYQTRRAEVVWDPQEIRLSEILAAIRHIGYRALPYDPASRQALLEEERRRMLKQLGIAGLFGMQVMMVSVGLYVGEWKGMDPAFRSFLHWVALLLTLPVLLYSARAFFVPAWRSLRAGRIGMDLPVSLALLLAFGGSLWVTVSGSGGKVWFDSVVMFTFFLLLGRYAEMASRKKANETVEALIQAVPAMACRLLPEGKEEVVPVARLEPGDRLRVRPGEVVPADGRIVEGESSVDESLLTGESRPRRRVCGEEVIGGSINVEGPLVVEINRTAEASVLSRMLQLVERAQAERPHITRIADESATWFIGGVLLLAAGATGLGLAGHLPDWFDRTLAMLVATCPCALSLATPAALTAAGTVLMRQGVLPTRSSAIETLARISCVVFDKTGTLTVGRLRLERVEPCAGMSREECLRLAAALEQSSEHPLARALLEAAADLALPSVTEVRNSPGAGLTGLVEGHRLRLGSVAHIAAQIPVPEPLYRNEDRTTLVLLADEQRVLARFHFSDPLREEASGVIEALRRRGMRLALLSGDAPEVVQRVAGELGIEEASGGLLPEQKLERLRELQRHGPAAMVGDGINDAPVLAAAPVSFAMGEGSQLVRARADLVLLGGRLEGVVGACDTARAVHRVIRQNIAWAIGYNLLALPAAALGYLTPWLAAIGMSASSLVVVLNALRLLRQRPWSLRG